MSFRSAYRTNLKSAIKLQIIFSILFNLNNISLEQRSLPAGSQESGTQGGSVSTAGSVAYLNGSSEIILYKTLDLLSGISFSFRTCFNGGTIIKFDSAQSVVGSGPAAKVNGHEGDKGNSNVAKEANGRTKKMIADDDGRAQYLFLRIFINPDGYIDITFRMHQTEPLKTINHSITLNTSSPINDNRWHLVELRIKNYELILTFDHTTFNLIQLGPEYKNAPWAKKDSTVTPHIQLGRNLRGCIQQGANIVFNYQEIASKNVLWDNCPLETSGPCNVCTDFEGYCLNGGECVPPKEIIALEQCLCRVGYMGNRCQFMSLNNTCASKPCQNEARCIPENKSETGYECACTKGYEGKNCDINKNECAQHPCRNGSTCVDTPGNFQCLCALGYDGPLCEYRKDECDKKPCKNSGTCMRKSNSYKCQCPATHMGYDCEIPLSQCKAASCPANALCVRNNGDIICKCHQGFTGKNCDQDINECQSLKVNPCENNGQCVNEVGDYKCICPPEWMGDNCIDKFDPCLHQPCLNNGTCYDYKALKNDKTLNFHYYTSERVTMYGDKASDPKTKEEKLAKYNREQYYCSCIPGFKGKDCEENIDDCLGVKCPPGKICIDKLDNFDCVCPRGFEGPTCNININDCDPMPCHNNATCVDEIDGYTCKCPSGYKGRLCEEDIDECREKICIYGICSNSFGNYRCYCIPGFTGRHCDVNFDDCASQPCQNGGICTDLLDNYACVCKAGFRGKNCQVNVDECASNPCSGNGNCTDGINGFTCNCFPGFIGTLCEQDIDECHSNPCKNGGKCSDKVNGFQCDCADTGFGGDVCEIDIDECHTQPCMNGGSCENLINDHRCRCEEGFEGKNCEVDIDECLSNPCLNGGTCSQKYNISEKFIVDMEMKTTTDVSNDGILPLRYNCSCVPGFTGTNCEVNIDECQENPCLFGVCVDEINGFHCNCEPGYEGKLCDKDINECLRDRPCQNNGFCHNLVNNYTCKCHRDYGGRNCEIKLKGCTEHLCPEKTECWPYLKNETEHTYECHCLPGLAGKACNIITLVSFFGSNVSFSNPEVTEVVGDTDITMSPLMTELFESMDIEISATSVPNVQDIKIDNTSANPLYESTITSSNTVSLDNKEDSSQFPTFKDIILSTVLPSYITITNHLSTASIQIDPNSDLSPVTSSKVSSRKRRSIPKADKSDSQSDTTPKKPNISASYVKVPLERLSSNSYYDYSTAYYNYIYSNVDKSHYEDYYMNLHFEFVTTLKSTNIADISMIPRTATKSGGEGVIKNARSLQQNNTLAQYTRINLRIDEGKLVCTLYKDDCGVDEETNLLNRSSRNSSTNEKDDYLQDNKGCYMVIFTSNQNVDKGDWQTIVLNKTINSLTIDLTNEEIFSSPLSTGINVLHSLYLGGTPPSNELFKIKNFIGCMRDIYVNDLLVLPESKSVVASKVENSCHRLKQCYETSCSGNGKCIDEWNSYACNCRRPYHGVDCRENFDEITFGHELNKSLIHMTLPKLSNISQWMDMDISFFIKTRLHDSFLLLLVPHNLSNISHSMANVIEKLTEDHIFYLEVCLNQGSLQVTLQDASVNRSISILRTDIKVVDENYPFVRILKMKDDLIIIIDTKRFVQKNFFPQQLPIFYIKDIYIGSVPKKFKDVLTKCGKGEKTRYFKGTLWDFRIWNEIMALTNLTMQHNVTRVENMTLNDRIIIRDLQNLTLGSPSDNTCRINPCVNGAKCLVTWNDYSCLCLTGFKGKNCETYDPCASIKCQSETLCFAPTNTSAECLELVIFEGRKYQGITYAQRASESKVIQRLNAQQDFMDITINFKYRTRTSECLLFHMANTNTGNFITLYIIKGKFLLKYDLWNNVSIDTHYINSPVIISKGEWAYINITFTQDNIEMDINGNVVESTHQPDKVLSLWNLVNTSNQVYLGGVPETQVGNIPFDTTSQYKGCMNNVAIFSPYRKFLLPMKKSEWDNDLEFDTIFKVSTSNGVYQGCSPPNTCKVDSCKNGGTCVDIFDAYNCTCPPGFNGSVCQNNINDCVPDACVNGTCIDGIMSYHCQCFPGYSGERCDMKIDPCKNNPCQNGGICTIVNDLNFTCNCGPSIDFVGEFCHIPINYNCSSGNICINNGICTDGIYTIPNSNKTKSFDCQCPPNFGGILCEREKDFCFGNKCQNGMCLADVQHQNYTCKCNEGFRGIFCTDDVDECLENPDVCKNRGICNNFKGNYTCTCAPGWTGKSCSEDINECADITNNPCLHHGICNNELGNFSCNCNSTSYTGPFCERDIDECEEALTSLCNDNGRCLNIDGSYQCECHKGYSGLRCDSANCSLIQCEHNGTCQITPNNTWKCLCSQNSYGRFCENLSFCLYEPCVSGICLNRPNPRYGVNYTCECDATHTGPNCSEPIDHCAKDNACLQGNCVNGPTNYTCQCFPGYSGADCSININDCDPNPCNNSGTCLDDINSFKCLCDGTGFEGPTCDEDVNECLQNPCKNNGTCLNLPGSYKCQCPGYLGDNCAIANPCEPNPCSNGGVCKTAIANDVAIHECRCVKPFEGDTCDINPNAEPLQATGGERRVRNITALIAGPIAAIILFVGLIALIAFILTARKKRATRGAYSPSKQEVTGSRVELDHVLKPPLEERLI